MLNKSYLSPALTALGNKSSLTLLSRSQWVGYEPSLDPSGDAPSTQFLNFSAPLSIKKLPLSIGVNVIYDKLGEMTNLTAQATIAYHKALSRGVLSVGLRPEIINRSLNFSKLRFMQPYDPFDVKREESQMKFDLGAGISYSTPRYLVALGLSHLLQPFFDYGIRDGKGKSYQGMNIIYNLYGEYHYALTYNLQIEPSILARTDLNVFSLDLGVVAKYNKRLWGGLTYRFSEALVAIIGYSFLKNQKLKIGYSIDYVIQDQKAKRPTSHEVSLRLDLPSLSGGTKQAIRTPRFRY